MMTKDTGGPAFPGDAGDGMTLRDWFAGQALAGIARTGTYDTVMAKQAYSAADAMLAERSKP